MRKLFVFLIFILPIVVMGQNFRITGSAPFFAGEKVTILKYTNRLSDTKTILKQSIISDSGNFNFDVNLAGAEVIILKIELREVFFHVHPGTHLQLNFKSFNNSDNQRLPIPYSQEYISIPENIAADSTYTILEDDFAESQLSISKTKPLLEIYDEFFKKSEIEYSNYLHSDSLFFEYFTYFKARAYLRTSISKTQLAETYISSRPIIYTNDTYLTFFESLMSPHVNSIFAKNPDGLEKAKNEFKIYGSLLEMLETDTIFTTDESRSLALLLYVKSKASNRYLNENTKAAIIGQMANFCIFPEQKGAAQEYQKKHSKLSIGSEAPTFSLADKDFNEIQLTSFRGKSVYLAFIHSNSSTCQKDLLIIEKLRKKYRKMSFVIVVVDRDNSNIQTLPKSSGNITVLYLQKNYEVLEKYEVWNFPVYYLLDDHGYFLQSTANDPSNIFDTFEKMFRRKSNRKSYEIIK